MTTPRKPRLGFLGVGWIGRNRMEALLRADIAEIVAIADPSTEMLDAAAVLAPDATRVASLEAILATNVDGVVIATPSAQHAGQSILALRHGAAVFCQKPLGRTATEVRAVLDAARAANRLLAVDLSYRFTAGMIAVREQIQSGAIGKVYAVDLVFHNAYGPDKPWFYDRALAGGGCVMDLGVHLIDLCLWVLGGPVISDISARLFAQGARWHPADQAVEDHAEARFDLDTGATVRLACSWKLSLGCDAAISATFHGTAGGAAFRNVDGSFYNFTAELYRGTTRTTLAEPPDDWGGRAAIAWASRLAAGTGFDPAATDLITVAAVMDGIYAQAKDR